MKKISIIGAGSYGTALAERLSWNDDNQVVLFSIENDVVESINKTHINEKYFPGRRLSPTIRASGSYNCLEDSDVVLIAIPSCAVESVVESCVPHIRNECLVVNLAKGIALDGGVLFTHFPFKRSATLKGPTFAIELFNGLPSALTLSSYNEADFELMKTIFSKSNINLDYTTDVFGVEYVSVLKNVYAIVIGILSGRYNSPNVDFILLTKALNEIREFLKLTGCSPDTILKYCGIGDLGLTALNDLSRNRTLGLLIGKGFLGNTSKSSVVAEGLRSVKIMAEKVTELSKGECGKFQVLIALKHLLNDELSLQEFSSLVMD